MFNVFNVFCATQAAAAAPEAPGSLVHSLIHGPRTLAILYVVWCVGHGMTFQYKNPRASIEAEADPGFFLARVCTIYGYHYAQLEPTSVRVPNTQH